MRFRQRLGAFQIWLTPKRKRWAGVLLIALALVGMVVSPEGRWRWVLATGVLWLMAAWLPRRH